MKQICSSFEKLLLLARRKDYDLADPFCEFNRECIAGYASNTVSLIFLFAPVDMSKA